MMEESTMAVLRIKFTMRDVDRHGNVRHYFRKGGRKIRLPGLPGSREFMDAYAAALEAPKPERMCKDPSSIDALLTAFYRSLKFKKLSPQYQRTRKLILEKFAADHGWKPYAKLEKRHILEIRDTMADRPGAATNFVKAIRSLFEFAVDYGYVKQSAAIDVEYLKTGGEGFHSWTIEEVRQFEDFHPIGTKARLAMALLLYTGQRRSDVVTFGRQMVRDGRLHYIQRKTGKRMTTRIIGPLQQIIDATPSKGLAFIETTHGHPYSSNGFGNAFREWCDEAGLPNCSAHGLRKAMGARLAELGATTKQIQNALGHETLAQASLYTKAAEEQIGSDAALELFENATAPLSNTVGQKGVKNA